MKIGAFIMPKIRRTEKMKIGFLSILTIIFVIAKLLGIINWS